ncbi:unnamed protein product [Mytilus edulis]|uniref:Uncharacterized protein n=1 Tax=Mytilus edulis TaxID=6550 RepID=A0A8S3VBH7_MYTED|nr:unnamed protein product [Mytilus edulis]
MLKRSQDNSIRNGSNLYENNIRTEQSNYQDLAQIRNDGNSIYAVTHNSNEYYNTVQTENTKGKNVLKDIQTQKDEFNKNADQLTEEVQQMMKVEKSLKVGLQPNIQLWNSYIPKFLPRRRDSSSVGSLTVDKVELRVNKQYITELKYCHSMSMCSDYLLWLNDCVSSVLMKVKLDEENITITNIKTTIRGFAITTDSDIVLADATPRLKLLSGQNGKIKESKYSVVPLTIISVCITREHRVIVGAESWSNYTCHRKTSDESNG